MLGKQPPTQFGFDNLPPHPPPTRWSMFKMMLVGYLLDLPSDRRLLSGRGFVQCWRFGGC